MPSTAMVVLSTYTFLPSSDRAMVPMVAFAMPPCVAREMELVCAVADELGAADARLAAFDTAVPLVATAVALDTALAPLL